MQRCRLLIAKLLCCSAWIIGVGGPTWAADTKGPSRSDCANYNLPFDERLVRSCDAQYGLCAKPPPAWSGHARLMQTCTQIAREKKLSSAPSGAPGHADVVAPRLLNKPAQAAPTSGASTRLVPGTPSP